MTLRIKALAELALHKDLFPISVPVSPEGYNRDDPMDVAKYIREYLLSQQTLVREDEALAGAFRFASAIPCDHTEADAKEQVPEIIPTDAYHKIGHVNTTKFFRPNSDYNPEGHPVCFLDWDHYCTNYPFVLSHGVKGYLERIQRAKEVHKHSKNKVRYLDAMEYTCESIRLYTQKVANDYLVAGRKDLAERVEKVPWNAPETFLEAIQAYWFTWLFLPDCLGRMDQILYPYYLKDLSNGTITKETAYEVICEFMVKVFSGRPGGGFTDHRSADNTFSIGGYTENGEDGFNDISRMIIEALVELPTWRPQANVRFTKKTPFEVYRYVTEKNRFQSNVVFTNDEVRIPAFIKLGMTYEDAVQYTMVGCNEWTAMGKGHTGSQGFFNPLHALEMVLAYDVEKLNNISTFDEFYSVYEKELAKDVALMMDMADEYFDNACKDVNVITSIFIDDCIEKATPITAGGARYSVSNWSCNGFSNIVDSLSVVEQFVYANKVVTLAELACALKHNWKGHELLRNKILTEGTFWGNNNKADLMANRFIATLEKLCKDRKPKKGGVFRFGSYTGYNSSNVSMGKMTGATPDGRWAGDCLCPAMNAGPGKMKNGLTSYLVSVAKNDYSFLIGPLATNITLDASMADSPEKLDKLAHLFKTFMDLGGLQLQPTYLSADELEKAQITPEEYSDLRVRVTGFSATFTKLDKGVQDEVITRQRVKNA